FLTFKQPEVGVLTNHGTEGQRRSTWVERSVDQPALLQRFDRARVAARELRLRHMPGLAKGRTQRGDLFNGSEDPHLLPVDVEIATVRLLDTPNGIEARRKASLRIQIANRLERDDDEEFFLVREVLVEGPN